MRVRQQLMGAVLAAVLGTGTAWAQSAVERGGEDVKRGAERAEEGARQEVRKGEQAWEGHEAEEHAKRMGKAQTEKAEAINNIALFDQEQIALGTLARERSTNPAVKEYADNLIDAHQNNLDALQDYAAGEDLTVAMIDLSTEGIAMGGGGTAGMTEEERAAAGYEKGALKEAAKLDEKSQKRVDKFIEKRDELAMKSGRDFDRDFLERVKDGQDQQEKAVRDAQKKYRDDAALTEALMESRSAFEQNKGQLREVERNVRRQG